ncbi:MAG: Gx transporter family protein [Clostridia bacterium]|nr:Gx transporter family protein [Clostridia bacterium]
MIKTKRLALDAVLAAIALLLFLVEAQIPPLTSIPGVKIGLANAVTLFAVCFLGKKDAAAILFVRVILGAVFAGNLSTFFYSASGAVCCYLVTCILYKPLCKTVWVLSVFGAAAHNAGQLLCACILLQSPSVFWYFPYLLIAAVISGAFTGICVHLILRRMKNRKEKWI